MKNETPSEELILKHASGREILARISDRRSIASGAFGDVFAVHADIGGRRISLVLKDYRADRLGEFGKNRAKTAFANYVNAKAAGLRVFLTFRLAEEQGCILMTNGLNDDTVCISTNDEDRTTVEDFGRKKLETIDNADELFEEVFSQVAIAHEKRINLGRDSFLFLVERGTDRADFVIGDMDFVHPLPRYGEIAHAENMHGAYKALQHLIINNVENPNELVKKLTRLYWEKMDALGIAPIHTNPTRP